MILKLKEFLVSRLGWLGYGIWFAIYLLLVFPGFIFLGMPFWAKLIFTAAVILIPSLVFNLIAQVALWAFSFPTVLASPLNIFSVWYYICFVIFLITTVIIPIISIIKDFYGNKRRF